MLRGLSLVITSILCLSVVANAQHYEQHNLVSDIAGMATVTDPNLVNPWGLARSSTGPWWVADNGTGVSTIYNGSGTPAPLVVTVPGNGGPGTPTGAVFNGSANFEISRGNPAIFIFVGEDGTISGWNPNVDPAHAVIVAQSKGSIFKGATIADLETGPFLYAADFHEGRIAVFDKNFHAVPTNNEAFEDQRLPSGYAPFNVQNVGGNLYVTFARQGDGKSDELAGPGFGFVDVFNSHGQLLQRLEHGDWLNAPWGVALAPSDFGTFSHRLLVGQFGSGEIAAYDVVTGKFAGMMKNTQNQTLEIEGLWALSFGNSAQSGSFSSLFFTAGIDDEAHGLFGSLTPIPSELTAGNGR
jgi:uncharacterized protein (TIGR03118 family)